MIDKILIEEFKKQKILAENKYSLDCQPDMTCFREKLIQLNENTHPKHLRLQNFLEKYDTGLNCSSLMSESSSIGFLATNQEGLPVGCVIGSVLTKKRTKDSYFDHGPRNYTSFSERNVEQYYRSAFEEYSVGRKDPECRPCSSSYFSEKPYIKETGSFIIHYLGTAPGIKEKGELRKKLLRMEMVAASFEKYMEIIFKGWEKDPALKDFEELEFIRQYTDENVFNDKDCKEHIVKLSRPVLSFREICCNIMDVIGKEGMIKYMEMR